jgi:hypothetical protein
MIPLPRDPTGIGMEDGNAVRLAGRVDTGCQTGDRSSAIAMPRTLCFRLRGLQTLIDILKSYGYHPCRRDLAPAARASRPYFRARYPPCTGRLGNGSPLQACGGSPRGLPAQRSRKEPMVREKRRPTAAGPTQPARDYSPDIWLPRLSVEIRRNLLS